MQSSVNNPPIVHASQPPPPPHHQHTSNSAASLGSSKPRDNDFCGVEDSPAGIYVDFFKWEVPSFDSWLGVSTKGQEVSLEVVFL
jgi:hypothetical protein